MTKRILMLSFFMLAGIMLLADFLMTSSAAPSAQDALAEYKQNNCVQCHQRTTGQLALSNRYYEWHTSQHREKGVSCDKCHGGDPSITDAKKAHEGVLKISDPKSRLHPKNLAQTCGTCHQAVVSSFVESSHYRKLKETGIGPSCNTCHAHMASEVVSSPDETATLCASCHNSTNTMMPKRPEIPDRAKEVMLALRRASSVVTWAERLLEEGQNKKADVGEEQGDYKAINITLREAKTSWHAFNLEAVRNKADKSFEQGNKLKDDLRKKLYPQQVP